MKKCMNDRANHENLDLSCLFKWTNHTKEHFKTHSIFASAPSRCISDFWMVSKQILETSFLLLKFFFPNL